MTKKNPFLNIPEESEYDLILTKYEAQKHLNDDLIGQSMYYTAKEDINVLNVSSQLNQNGEYWSNIVFEYRYHPYNSPQGTYVWRKYVMEWNHASGPLYVGIARGEFIISRVRHALENGEKFTMLREWVGDEGL